MCNFFFIEKVRTKQGKGKQLINKHNHLEESSNFATMLQNPGNTVLLVILLLALAVSVSLGDRDALSLTMDGLCPDKPILS